MKFEVINLATDESHGTFDTIAEARGCVAYDRLKAYEIWQVDSEGDHIARMEVCEPYNGNDDRARQGLGLWNASEMEG
jgi:hypothetical protein